MDGPERAIDEEVRRRFEASRLSGEDRPLESFLPDEGDPRYLATLEELVCIDLEFGFKRGRAIRSDDYMERFPALREEASAARVREEERWLRRRFARAAPRRIGRYELREMAGRGAFAEVWRAWDTDLRREVAIKLTRPELADSADVLERVYREARSAAQLRHPCIVPVHEVAVEDGQPFIVSDFVRGPTLARVLREGLMPVEEAARQLARVAEAVEYAHQCGVIHRDLKPGNILLGEDDRPLLTDFGLAQFAGAEAELTRQGDLLGTPAYMSPEQALGDTAHTGPRSDVYGLGAVLYEMLTGRRPFDGPSGASILHSVVHDEPVAPRSLRPEIPLDLETVCLKALAKEPALRYSGAGALAEELHRFLGHQPVQARRLGPFARARLWVRRNRTLAATLGLGVGAVALVGLLGLLNVLRERDRFLRERDHAQANLIWALRGEAEALLRARGPSWYDHAMSSLGQAAVLADDDENRSALRDLVIRCQGVTSPSFRRVDEWDAGGAAVRQVGGDDSYAAWLLDGRVQVRDLGTGDIAVARLEDDDLACFAPVPGRRALVTGSREGWLHLWELDPGPRAAAHARLDDAIPALCVSSDGTGVAVARPDGTIELRSLPDFRITQRLAGHRGGTLALAYAPLADALATGGMDATVRLWDGATGRALWAFGTDDPVRTLAFAPDGSRVAYATHETYGFGVVVRSGPIHELHANASAHEGAVRQVAYSPLGLLVSASADGSLRCWRADVEIALARVRGPVGAMAVIGGRGRILSSHADGRLRVWELHESEARVVFATQHAAAFIPGQDRVATHSGQIDLSGWPGHAVRPFDSGSVHSLLADAEGAAVVTGRGDGAIVVSSLAAQERARWQAHDAAVVALARDGTGTRLASAGAHGPVKVWRRSGEWTLEAVLATEVGSIHSLAWDEDTDTLVVAGERGIDLIRKGGQSHLALAPVSRRAVAAGGGTLAASLAAGAIEIHDLAASRRVRTWTAHSGTAICLALLAPRGLLVSAGSAGEIAVLDLRDGSDRRVAHEGLRQFDWIDTDAAGLLLAGGGRGETGVVFDLSSLRPIAALDVLSSSCGAFATDGTLLVGSANGAVWGWDAAPLRAEAERAAHALTHGEGPAAARLVADKVVVSGGHRAHVWGVAASPDGRWVTTTSHAGAIKLWDARDGRLVRDLQLAGPITWNAAFSPDSRRLAACCGSEVILYEAESGREIARLLGHEKLVVQAVFHPRLPLLATAAMDRSLRFWDLERLQPLGEPWRAPTGLSGLSIDAAGRLAAACADGCVRIWDFGPSGRFSAREPDRVIEGHGSAVWAVAFDPTGRFLASGSEGGRVLLRDAASFRLLAALQGETRRIRSLSFDGAGRRLAVGCYIGSSIVWDLAALQGILAPMGLQW